MKETDIVGNSIGLLWVIQVIFIVLEVTTSINLPWYQLLIPLFVTILLAIFNTIAERLLKYLSKNKGGKQ